MEIRTIGSGIDVDSALDAYVKRSIYFALGRFSSRVEPRAYLGDAARRAIRNPGEVTLAWGFK